jgi:hypothetical protein
MKNHIKISLIVTAIVSIALVASSFAAVVDETFTYQGQLKQDGQPANGAFDVRFRLFNDTAAVVSGPICFDGVEVINGLFTVDLNFGNMFDGNARELEVAVRAGGAAGDCASGVYTVLAPRQPIVPAPYAMFALDAPAGHSLNASDGNPVDALAVNAVGDVGIGTTSPEADLHIFRGSAGTISANGNAPFVVENNTHAYINILAPDANESGILFGRPGSPVPSAAGGILFNSAPTNDGLQFRNGGNQIRMVLDSIGNLGLGTAGPAGRLHIVGAAAPPASQVGTNNGLILGSNGTSEYKWIQSYGGPLSLNLMGNNVGIGTSAPSARLHIGGTPGVDGIKFPDGTLQITSSRGDGHSLDAADGSPVDALFVNSSGNVGIGTTTAGFPLTFANTLGDKISLWGQSGNHYGFGIQSNLLQIHADAVTSDIAFGVGSSASFTERMRMTGDGDLGIGTSAPATKLDVVKSVAGESVARFRQSSAGIHTAISVDSLAGQDPILYLTQNGAAQWGIRSDTSEANNFQIRWHGDGTNDTVLEISKAINSEWQLKVDGHVIPANDEDYQIGDPTHRWTSVYATNAFIQTSDARQKKDVVALDYGLKELLSLRPVSFKWKKESDPRVHLGLISQEVEPIVPEAVVKDAANPDTPWAMTYTTLIPVLIKAVQEQQEIINSQRDRFEENRTEQAQERAALSKDKDAKIAELEARIAKLEAMMETKAARGN